MSPQKMLLFGAMVLLAGFTAAAILLSAVTRTTQPVPCSATRPSVSITSPSGTEPISSSRPIAERHRPLPAAAGERREERARMVDAQIAHPWDGRQPVKDPRVLDAMRAVPRHAFVPASYRSHAYADTPLPIGHEQTISQPYIVALMTERLRLTPDAKVLEIGTGSGYQAAVLAHLTSHVYTIEIIEALGQEAKRTLRQQGYEEVHCRVGDGYKGWPEAAPFDGIIVTCAAEDLPQPLWEQLKPGGRIVIPTGEPFQVQQLVVITKTSEGKRQVETLTAVQFVPLIRNRVPQPAVK